MAKFRVRVWAHLPASAEMTVEAETRIDAEDYAVEHFEEASWDGSDYSRPDGSMIESAETVEEL